MEISDDAVEITVADNGDDSAKESSEPAKTTKSKGQKRISAAKKLQMKLDDQQEIIDDLVKERDSYKDKYLRSLAEIDNFRKRMKKEKDEFQKYVLGDFILEMLQVYDNLDRALKSAATSDSGESILSGVEMIFNQFSSLLKKFNVEEIESLNKPFDPNIHQALSKVEQADIETPLVVEVYQKGFLYNGKLLRPTFAKVAIPIADDDVMELED